MGACFCWDRSQGGTLGCDSTVRSLILASRLASLVLPLTIMQKWNCPLQDAPSRARVTFRDVQFWTGETVVLFRLYHNHLFHAASHSTPQSQKWGHVFQGFFKVFQTILIKRLKTRFHLKFENNFKNLKYENQTKCSKILDFKAKHEFSKIRPQNNMTSSDRKLKIL